MMLEVAFFDILVDIFIERKLSKMVIALFTPFINANTPDEVKATLKEEAKLPESVYHGLFRKGIMNNFSPSMKRVMLPRKEPKVVRELRRAASVEIS